ncbi:hypothetical protein BH11BAC1_BH11BAC1_12770 [soil metagenome]
MDPIELRMKPNEYTNYEFERNSNGAARYLDLRIVKE